MSNADELKSKLVGYYKKKNIPTGKPITINDFFEGIKANEEWKRITLYAREVRDDEVLYDERKQAAPVVILSGTYGENKSGENMLSVSGFMGIDLDHLNERTAAVLSLLMNDPFVVAVFPSIGGRGLCIVFRVEFERWIDAFNGICQYLTVTYGLVGKQFDQTAKNKNRLRFISSYPELVVNWNARLFNKYPKKEKKVVKPHLYINTQRDIDYLLEQIHDNQIDITPGYDEWYQVAWALIAEYGEGAREIFRAVSQYNDKFDPEECDAKFNYLVDTRPHTVSISYFYAACFRAGLDLTSPISKAAGMSAAQSKKNAVSLESAINKIVETTNITAEEARPVVEQIYKSRETFQSDDSIFDQLELFLRQNYSLRYNEVRRVFEDQHENAIQDSDLYAMYIDARKIVSEDLKYPDFNMLIHSHKVFPRFHPIKAFINENKHLKPVGKIKALIQSINSDTGLKEGEKNSSFVYKYMRKFIIGMIENVYDDIPCPLVPIFTGKPNTGKTYWFTHLLPEELRSYLAQMQWATGKDELLRMCTHWIAFNDDIDLKDQTNQGQFRRITSQDWVTVREPYGRKDVRLRRLAIMCGTSNPKNIIQEPEFNRRIIAINIISLFWDVYNSVDKTEVFIEAFHAYNNGERSRLTDEDVAELQATTVEFHDLTLEQQLIDQYFERPVPEANLTHTEFLSTTEIMTRLELHVNNRKLNLNNIGAALQARKFSKGQKRSGGRNKHGYFVIYLGETMRPVTFSAN